MLTWSEFLKQDADAWKTKAAADSKGKYDVAKLHYNVEDDFIIDAFQTETLATSTHISNNKSKSGLYIYGYSQPTSVLNNRMLKHLESGIDSLVIDVDDSVDLSVLLTGIYPDMVEITLLKDDDRASLQTDVQEYIKTYYPENRDDVHIAVEKPFRLSAGQKHAARLRAFYEQISQLDTNETMVIITEMKQDFLAQLAELRAMRLVWNQSGRAANDLKIIATVTGEDRHDVHPMIVANYQMMSAVLGGVDIVAPMMSEEDESVRLMLNMMHIFREESRLDFVQDPLAGAYIPEALTVQMANYCIDAESISSIEK